MRKVLLFAVPVLLLVAVAWAALAQGEPFDVPWATVDGGGGESAGGSYSVRGTAGQSDAGGKLAGGTYGVTGGFWPGVAAKPPPVAVADLQTQVDTDAAAGVKAVIPQVYDPQTQNPLPQVAIGGYQALLQYNGALLNVLEVRLKAPFGTGTVTIDNPNGSAQFNASAPGGASWPIDPLAFATLRLLGCTNQTATLTPTFSQILDNNDVPLIVAQPVAKTFRRGDAKPDGGVAISDVLFIAQYLVGIRTAGDGPTQVNAVNAASVKQDVAFDRITAADALVIAQYLVGIRDGCFNLVPAGAPPQR